MTEEEFLAFKGSDFAAAVEYFQVTVANFNEVGIPVGDALDIAMHDLWEDAKHSLYRRVRTHVQALRLMGYGMGLTVREAAMYEYRLREIEDFVRH